MGYNPVTDFIGLWRQNGGTSVSKLDMPGLDFVVSALARAGIVTVSVSATAPGANQSTTAWLQTAVPSYSAEGALYLWDANASAYALATPSLFYAFLQASARVSGVSWWYATGGPPANTVGHDGDLSIRTDTPGGIYGPKALGAWPAAPISGTSNVIESGALDNTFGGAQGNLIFRGAALWQSLPIGVANDVLTIAGGAPLWQDFSALLDALFGGVQGSVLYRGGLEWASLPPGNDNTVLTTHGSNADPSWTVKSTEFSTGDTLLFYQNAAPLGWTKRTDVNDVGLRVTSGAVGVTPGSPFSTVFSQVAVGNTTLTVPQTPNHIHANNAAANIGGSGTGGGSFTINAMASASFSSVGGDQPHNHAINMSLAYIDVILATKD